MGYIGKTRYIGKLQEDQEGQWIGHQVHVEVVVMERSAAVTKALRAMNSGRNFVDSNELMGLSANQGIMLI